MIKNSEMMLALASDLRPGDVVVSSDNLYFFIYFEDSSSYECEAKFFCHKGLLTTRINKVVMLSIIRFNA